MFRTILNKRVILIAVLIAVSGFLVSCQKHRGIEGKAEWISDRISDKLDLNETQEKELNRIRDEVVAKFKAQKPVHLQVSSDFIALVKSDSMDKAKLNDLKNKHGKLSDEMDNFLAEKIIEFHKVLNPEQRMKAAEYLQKFHNRLDDKED